MKRQFVINVAYRLRNDKTAPIQEMQLVAHSIQDAKSAFKLWQRQQQGRNNAKPLMYVFISGTKLKEVTATEEQKSWMRGQKSWMRLDPKRLKSQIYVCPFCKETCYCQSDGCNYTFCPRCGRKVL